MRESVGGCGVFEGVVLLAAVVERGVMQARGEVRKVRVRLGFGVS